jgi:hypothetical protein
MTAARFVTAMAVAAMLAAPAAAQTTAPAANADALGTWDVTFATQNGGVPSQLVLKKDGDKITGTISSQMGGAPVEAELKGNKLTVWFNFDTGNGAVPIEMDGTITGDAVKGDFGMGGQPGGTFEGKKSANGTKDVAKDTKESKDTKDLTGTWIINLSLGEISATPSFELKQDGDKLTGKYISTVYGEAPVTGTVKGADVSITFSMNVEGNAMTATYTGKLDGDTMKGSCDYGGQMQGTFSATKKK